MANANLSRSHGWMHATAARGQASEAKAARLSAAMQSARSLKEAAWMAGISERTSRRLRERNA